MSKIYDASGIKLTNIQVTKILMNDMPESHAVIIAKHLSFDTKCFRREFAHAILDSYKSLPVTNEAEEKSKKYCRHLMDKYMKSSTVADGEESAMQLLVGNIKTVSNSNAVWEKEG